MQTLTDLGEQLAEQRQLKGLTIAQLSSVTKISPSYIELMEKGSFDFLPDVYVKAFLRTIAKEIGLDPEVIGKQFLAYKAPSSEDIAGMKDEAAVPDTDKKPVASERKQHTIPTIETENRESHAKKKFPWWLNPFLLGGLAIILSILLFILPSNHKTNRHHEIESGITIAKGDSKDGAETASFIPLTATTIADTGAQKTMVLQLHATETAWVRIVYNDSLTEEGLFSAGDSRMLTVRGSVYLKIGNAGGIYINLDGKDLGLAGSKGRVANLLIDSEGLKVIPDTELPAAMKQMQP